MSTPSNEHRPRRTEGDEVQKAGGLSTGVNDSRIAADNVLITWPQSRWDDYLLGHTAGRAEGIQAGRELEAAELSRIQLASAQIVHGMSKIEPRVHAADMAAAERRESRWSK